MSVIDTLVTNRTAADVTRWKALRDKGIAKMTASELAEWLGGMKGAYNAADLNRVGEAMTYLATIFRSYGYDVSVSSRMNWTTADIPTQADMFVYLADVARLRGTVAMLESTPDTPTSMALLTWATANGIEKILADVDDALNRMAKSWLYSGEIYGGEV